MFSLAILFSCIEYDANCGQHVSCSFHMSNPCPRVLLSTWIPGVTLILEQKLFTGFAYGCHSIIDEGKSISY